MTQQLSVYDLMPSACPMPEMWECMETCVHCGEYMSTFPGTDKPRCDYGLHMDGTSGNNCYMKQGSDRIRFFCKYYERKEREMNNNTNNAEKFKQIFGIYATELWAMPEEEFLKWLGRTDTGGKED